MENESRANSTVIEGNLVTCGVMSPWDTKPLEKPKRPGDKKETMPDLSKN